MAGKSNLPLQPAPLPGRHRSFQRAANESWIRSASSTCSHRPAGIACHFLCFVSLGRYFYRCRFPVQRRHRRLSISGYSQISRLSGNITCLLEEYSTNDVCDAARAALRHSRWPPLTLAMAVKIRFRSAEREATVAGLDGVRPLRLHAVISCPHIHRPQHPPSRSFLDQTRLQIAPPQTRWRCGPPRGVFCLAHDRSHACGVDSRVALRLDSNRGRFQNGILPLLAI